MNPVKKLNIIMVIVISIPLILGLYLLRYEGDVLMASTFHFYFVLGSSLAALGLSIIAFIEYQRKQVPIVLMIAIGFLGVAIIYAFHGFITPKYSLFTFNIFRDQLNLFIFYGDLSRFWLAVFVFGSGLTIKKVVNKLGLVKSVIGLSVFLILIVLLMIYTPSLVPNSKHLDGTDNQFSILFKVATLVLLGITIYKYYNSYKIHSDLSIMFIIIGLSFVFGAVIIFMISTPWGSIWWMAHVLYLLTYLIIGFGMFYNYYKNQKIEYFDVFDGIKHYIDELDKSNKKLEIMTNMDTLTKVANRKYFMEKLDETIIEANTSNENFGILFVDIDDFKSINDKYGHPIGDIVLEISANRIRKAIKTDDLIARFAGDEFVVMVTNITNYDIAKVAERINETLRKVITINKTNLSIRASIGIALYPENGTTSNQLITHSDKAMYEVKKQGKDSFEFYDKIDN